MKKLFFVFLIALVTCSTIGKSSDANIVSKEKKIILPIRPKGTSGNTSRSSSKHTTRPTHKNNGRPTTKNGAKVTTKPTTITKKTTKDLINLPIKGINGLFKGKQGEAFRKLPEIIKKAIAWLKQNNLWNIVVNMFRNPGEQYDNFCGKMLPSDVCNGIANFIANLF